MPSRWPPESTCTKNTKNYAKIRAQGSQNYLKNYSFFIKNRAQNQCRILRRFLIDFWSQNATKFDENRMKSETKYREKLIRNKTLRKRCDINSDREKPYDSHDFLKLPQWFSIIKSLKNQQKTKPASGSQFSLKFSPKSFQNTSKMLPRITQNRLKII